MSVVLEYGALGLRRGQKQPKERAEAWPHQIDAWHAFKPTIGNKECPNCRLFSPTGSGKSLLIKKVSIGWAALGRVVIIAVPKESIKSGFRGQHFLLEGLVQRWAKPMNFTEDYKPIIRDLGETKALMKFLSRPDPDPARRSWVCTHQALLAAFRAGADFSNAFVVIDEAHHNAAGGVDFGDMNRGGTFVQHMLTNGIPHMLCTATPFRTDRRALTPRWAKHLYVTYTRERAEHIDDMRYVAGVNTRVEAGDVDDILNREFAKIKREKRKAIVSLPRVEGRFAMDYGRQLGDGCHTKYHFEDHVVSLAKRHGLSILSLATDESDQANGEELDRILTEFRENPKDPNAYAAIPDIVLVQERYKEGTDCVAWSTIIQIGLPGSPVEILQFQGRGTRDHKSKDGLLVEHLIIIPTPDPDDEKTFDHTLDTVKSLVILGFVTTYQFEELARTMEDGDSPLDRIEEQLKAVEQGKATPEQRKVLEVLGMVLPPHEEAEGAVNAPPPASDRHARDRDRDKDGDSWSPTPEALEPRPLQFLSKRFGLDVEAMSDDEVIKAIRATCLSMAKAIYKGFAKKYHAHLARHSQDSLRMEVITLYEQGNSLRQIVGKLSGRVTEDEVYSLLKATNELRPADRYRVKAKVRRPRAPQKTLASYLKQSTNRG